ncbi:cytidine and deoxycytidylate deaminase [Carp edema virus]|nr:cytidine and deoxycytidylate deaminase [Carp edema virus]
MGFIFIQDLLNSVKQEFDSLVAKGFDARFVHIAVIFARKKIISIGYNHTDKVKNYKDRPFNISKHAEIDALHKTGKINYKRCNILVVRLRKDVKGNYFFLNSKPCVECTNKIKKHNFNKVLFSNENNQIVEMPAEHLISDHRSLGTLALLDFNK